MIGKVAISLVTGFAFCLLNTGCCAAAVSCFTICCFTVCTLVPVMGIILLQDCKLMLCHCAIGSLTDLTFCLCSTGCCAAAVIGLFTGITAAAFIPVLLLIMLQDAVGMRQCIPIRLSAVRTDCLCSAGSFTAVVLFLDIGLFADCTYIPVVFRILGIFFFPDVVCQFAIRLFADFTLGQHFTGSIAAAVSGLFTGITADTFVPVTVSILFQGIVGMGKFFSIGLTTGCTFCLCGTGSYAALMADLFVCCSADSTDMPMLLSILCPLFCPDMICQFAIGLFADFTLGQHFTGSFTAVMGRFVYLLVTYLAEVPVMGSIAEYFFARITDCMLQLGYDHVLTSQTLLICTVGSFRTGNVVCLVFFCATVCTFIPVTGFIRIPFGLVVMLQHGSQFETAVCTGLCCSTACCCTGIVCLSCIGCITGCTLMPVAFCIAEPFRIEVMSLQLAIRLATG